MLSKAQKSYISYLYRINKTLGVIKICMRRLLWPAGLLDYRLLLFKNFKTFKRVNPFDYKQLFNGIWVKGITGSKFCRRTRILFKLVSGYKCRVVSPTLCTDANAKSNSPALDVWFVSWNQVQWSMAHSKHSKKRSMILRSLLNRTIAWEEITRSHSTGGGGGVQVLQIFDLPEQQVETRNVEKKAHT